MTKYERAWEKWDAIRPKDRGKIVAKRIYTSVGMRSMLEVFLAARLSVLKREGLIKKFEYEPDVFHYQHLPQKYTPDFKVFKKDGSPIYLEAKGKMVYETRKKMLSVQRDNPGLALHMVFESNGKIGSGSKTRYVEWAEKHGIPASLKDIKEEWYA